MTAERAKQLRAVIIGAMSKEDDDVALANASLLPEWGSGVEYALGNKIVHDGVVYKVLQNHTAQPDWAPDVAASLYARVLNPDEYVIPDWERPDSTNAYMAGDVVMYNGVKYESIIDNNVWSPDEYPAGWRDISTN